MKVALAHKRLDLKGGTERDLYKTAEGLRDLGHEVHLFCGEYGVPAPTAVTAHRVPVLRFGRTLRLWSFALWAPKVIEKANCDVVVSFGRTLRHDLLRSGGGTHRGFLQRMGAQSGALRRLWQAASIYHRSLLALERRQFEIRRDKKIIAVSAEVKRDIIANYGVAADRIEVLYNGVDAQRFHPARRETFRRSVRERCNIPQDARVVLFVGSGFRRKGLDRVIAAFALAKMAGIYLLVLGSDARLARYRDWADTIAPGRIIFAGRQEGIENYYAASDLAVLPALQEAFGNVVLESLASGLPILVSRNVGAAEVLEGRLANGIVDEPDKPEKLAAKILSFLAKNADGALVHEARKIGERYSWKNHFRRLEALLLEACGKPTTASVC